MEMQLNCTPLPLESGWAVGYAELGSRKGVLLDCGVGGRGGKRLLYRAENNKS